MSYLRYFCLFAYSGVQHICSSSVPYVASFSGLSFFFYYPFGILLLLFEIFSVLVFSVGLNVYHILEQPVQV